MLCRVVDAVVTCAMQQNAKRILCLFAVLVVSFVVCFIQILTPDPVENMFPGAFMVGSPKALFDMARGGRTPLTTINELPHVHVAGVNCAKIIEGDEKEVQHAIELQKYQIPKKVDFALLISDCEEYRKSRKYLAMASSKEEDDYPIAYSLVMYKDPEQAERLLRAIYQPQNYYCIHIDRRAARDVHIAMAAIANCLPNVALTTKAVYVNYGAFSMIEAEFACMEDLLSQPKWRYLINLTGQEFPLKTNLELVQILKTYGGANDIDGFITKTFQERTDYVHIFNKQTFIRKGPPPHGIRPTYGSMKTVMSRGFVDFILHNQTALDFREWVKNTGVPDETFFSSLNNNPHLGAPGAFTGNDLNGKPFMARYVNWVHKQPCAGKYVRQVCIFSVQDLPSITIRPELFVNKFHYDFHPLAYDCMEEWHFNRMRMQILGQQSEHFNISFYKSLSFVSQHI